MCISLWVNRHPGLSVHTAEQAVLTHFTAVGPFTPSVLKCSEALKLPEHSYDNILRVKTKKLTQVT